MRKFLLRLLLVTLAASGAYSPAMAFQVQCQPGYDFIRYYYDFHVTGPIVGIEVFYCDGSSNLIGRYGAIEDVQFCEMCD